MQIPHTHKHTHTHTHTHTQRICRYPYSMLPGAPKVLLLCKKIQLWCPYADQRTLNNNPGEGSGSSEPQQTKAKETKAQDPGTHIILLILLLKCTPKISVCCLPTYQKLVTKCCVKTTSVSYQQLYGFFFKTCYKVITLLWNDSL
jgi:hypothetical protein